MQTKLTLRVLTCLAGACICSPASALDLHLRCDGVGTFPEANTVTAYAYSGDQSINGSATSVGRGTVHDRFLVDVVGDTIRVRPPAAIVPPMHGQNDDGWWPLTEAKISDTEISGRFSLNWLNQPTVKIDRTNGSIEVQGKFKLSFRGTCEIADPAQRKF